MESVSEAVVPLEVQDRWGLSIVKYLGEEKVLIMSMYVAAVTYIAVPFITHMVLLCVVCFILGLGTGCGQPLSLTMVYNASPKGRAARL